MLKRSLVLLPIFGIALYLYSVDEGCAPSLAEKIYTNTIGAWHGLSLGYLFGLIN